MEPQRLRVGAGHGLGVLAKGWEFVFPNLCHQRPPPLQEESQFHPLEKSRDAPGALDGFFPAHAEVSVFSRDCFCWDKHL